VYGGRVCDGWANELYCNERTGICGSSPADQYAHLERVETCVAMETVRTCAYSAGGGGTPGTCAEAAQVSVAADKEACESITELANDVACQAVVSDIVAIAGTWVVDEEVTLATTCELVSGRNCIRLSGEGSCIYQEAVARTNLVTQADLTDGNRV
jgi:hypothetical protein